VETNVAAVMANALPPGPVAPAGTMNPEPAGSRPRVSGGYTSEITAVDTYRMPASPADAPGETPVSNRADSNAGVARTTASAGCSGPARTLSRPRRRRIEATGEPSRSRSGPSRPARVSTRRDSPDHTVANSGPGGPPRPAAFADALAPRIRLPCCRSQLRSSGNVAATPSRAGSPAVIPARSGPTRTAAASGPSRRAASEAIDSSASSRLAGASRSRSIRVRPGSDSPGHRRIDSMSAGTPKADGDG
jgi:hypothetical protein